MRCSIQGCAARRHSAGLCWRHLEESRARNGDLCSVVGCERGRFYRGMCGAHASAASREQHGRKKALFSITCAHCGQPAEVQKRSARYHPECAMQGLAKATERRRAAEKALRRAMVGRGGRGAPFVVTVEGVVHSKPPKAERPRIWVAGSCSWCSESFLIVDQLTARYCSDRCASAAGKYRRGRFLIPPRERLAIYERDGWTCQLCLEPVDPDLGPSDVWAATLDHIVCQSWGDEPGHSPSNLRLAHRWCNSVRSDERHHSVADLRAA